MDFTFTQLVFYSFASLLIVSALMVILSRNSVKAVLFLILSFVASAGLWMLLEAEFLAITLILVYVGAVMVLFIFVVMMLDVDFAAKKQGFNKLLPLALLFSIVLLLVLHWLLGEQHFGLQQFPEPAPHEASFSNVKQLGRLLYTDYFYPFELAAVLLLVAMVAAISLTFRGKRHRKSQDIDKQVATSKQDRLRVVKMKPVIPKESDEASS
jgi:NADH-quinone oxidoreductase subunit J